jgi:hypothetical protein
VMEETTKTVERAARGFPAADPTPRAVMAHDLASMPRSGLQAQLCGDAHLGNFGGYASPERTLVFDLNDCETLPGPFEWDRQAARRQLRGRRARPQPHFDAAPQGSARPSRGLP